MDDELICRICDERLLNEYSTVKEKGLISLIAASKRRQDGRSEIFKENSKVHTKCRKNYTRECSILVAEKALQKNLANVSSPIKAKLRSTTPQFSYKTCCFLCGEICDQEIEKKKQENQRHVISRVETLQIKDTLLQKANEFCDDQSQVVKSRIELVDLVAKEARYHRHCLTDFLKRRVDGRKRGRPEVTELTNAFEKVCHFIEDSDDCQFSLAELMDLMGNFCPSEFWIKKKLKEKYGDAIIITSIPKKAPIVCFNNTSHKILADSWYKEKECNERAERIRIVKTAAAIIKDDICKKHYEINSYPPGNEFMKNAESDIPETLNIFLHDVIAKGKKGKADTYKSKSTSIAHAIISAARPKTFISSLLLGVGTYIHRKFGSKLLLNILSKLGFSTSYKETILYEASVTLAPQPLPQPGAFSQYVFDNADYNIHTIDGKNTFHCMGGIMTLAPSSSVPPRMEIPKQMRMPPAEVIAKSADIPVKHFNMSNECGLENIIVKDLNEFRSLSSEDIDMISEADVIWMMGVWLKVDKLPQWNGFMEASTRHLPFEKTHISYLPFINLKANSPDAVFTVLHLASQKSREMSQEATIVTFDQPLYQLAKEISTKRPDLSNVVLRLGGFHLLMSYLGAVGYIMDGSGLKELWSLVYAKNSLDKMLSGHHFARALRAHMLTHTALSILILEQSNCNFSDTEFIKVSLSQFLNKSLEFDTLMSLPQVTTIGMKIRDQLKTLQKNGPTAQLWIEYFNMISLVKSYIKAERIGNWNLHLECVQRMIPYFHASGHLNYAKCAHMYLQEMYELPNRMKPEEFEKLSTKGYFSMRRSDKFWAGMWSDYTIEATLMRLSKSNGGITRGRGISPSVTARWILGMSACIDTCESLELFTASYSSTSEQHIQNRESSMRRDNMDVEKFVDWFHCHNPFQPETKIMSIATGYVGNETVNCHRSLEEGLNIMKAITGKNFLQLKLKRKDRVIPLAATYSGVKIYDTVTPINTTLLYQRIIRAAKPEDLKTCFRFELSPVPLSIFSEQGMRKTKKSALYEIFKPVNQNLHDSFYVIDGGFLLHKVIWKQNSTYIDIFDSYAKYIYVHYQYNCVVVFDGYCGTKNSTKNPERMRRSLKVKCADIKFDQSMIATTSQELFLSNEKNKHRFIKLLSLRLTELGIQVKVAPDDADLMIVETAIHFSTIKPVVCIVGEDVDLIILLFALAPTDVNIYFLKPGTKKRKQQVYTSQDMQAEKPELKKYILFLHAASGCDTTSSFFGIGKIKFVKLFEKHADLKQVVSIFYKKYASQEDIISVGEMVLLRLYGATKNTKTLDDYRFHYFSKLVGRSKKEVKLENIPPTSAASRQHFLRVYHQIQLWQGCNLDALSWGWKSDDNGLLPVTTLEPPAPEMFLKLVSCKCKNGCHRRCSCKLAGLECSNLCKSCSGIGCENSTPYVGSIDECRHLEDIFEEEQNITPEFLPSQFFPDREDTDEDDPSSLVMQIDLDSEICKGQNSFKRRRSDF